MLKPLLKTFKLKQVDIYINVLVYNSRAGVSMYTTPSKVMLLKIMVSFNQANTYFIKFLAISKAANWLQDPMCMAVN